ncbi:hypothetical protein [Mesobacillus jeotgali]|uniref:CYTH domain-containing protein n=1 Tax=Mesobacillus jeotgali TaxID=129985 RepID=A0ABY9VK63_9BACI|nr:hypothetical protein [Mesobacillus jeotgali]WNF21331.1 hypothetical protein RH061_14115 [Mesobacillus jeotgali]
MYDTISIFYKLDRDEYDYFFKYLNELSYNKVGKKLYKPRNDKNAYVTYAFMEYGFYEIKLRWRKDKNYRAIELFIKPKLLIETGNHYEVTNPEEMEKVREVFNRYAQKHRLPDLLFWNVKRIDYAIDINLPKEMIIKYLFLFKKSNHPEYMRIDKTTQRFFDCEHNLYLNSKNITINYYDRYKALKNKQLVGELIFLNTNRVRNKFRLEIQYKNCKGKLYNFLNYEFGKSTILYFYNLVIGPGAYLPLEKAIENTFNENISFKKGVKLRNFLKYIDNEGGIFEAKMRFIKENNNRCKAIKDFSKMLNDIRKLGLNPICLPSSWGMDQMPNLIDKINDQFDQIKSNFLN